MITSEEILKGEKLPFDLIENHADLLDKVNQLRKAYGKPMIVTSGFRSTEKHRAIYEHLGVKNPPMGSKHLSCQAIDVFDPEGNLKNFIVNNIPLMEEIGLWFEDFFHTHGRELNGSRGWCHIQIVPPASGKRFFKI